MDFAPTEALALDILIQVELWALMEIMLAVVAEAGTATALMEEYLAQVQIILEAAAAADLEVLLEKRMLVVAAVALTKPLQQKVGKMVSALYII